MIEQPNVDILNLLQNSEPTSELYECLISYTPSQHPLVYEEYDFASNFLKAISNMVSMIFADPSVGTLTPLPHYIEFW